MSVVQNKPTTQITVEDASLKAYRHDLDIRPNVESEINVKHNDIDLDPSLYTVSEDIITLDDTVVLEVGDILIFQRQTEILQRLSFDTGEYVPQEKIEEGVDKLTLIAQEVSAGIEAPDIPAAVQDVVEVPLDPSTPESQTPYHFIFGWFLDSQSSTTVNQALVDTIQAITTGINAVETGNEGDPLTYRFKMPVIEPAQARRGFIAVPSDFILEHLRDAQYQTSLFPTTFDPTEYTYTDSDGNAYTVYVSTDLLYTDINKHLNWEVVGYT